MGKSHIGSGSVTPGAVVAQKEAAFDFNDTGTFASGIVLPANSRIIDMYLDVGPDAWDSATDSLEVGTLADPDEFANFFDIQTEGRNLPLISSAQAVNIADIGPQDVPVILTITSGGGPPSEGAAVLVITYATTEDNF